MWIRTTIHGVRGYKYISIFYVELAFISVIPAIIIGKMIEKIQIGGEKKIVLGRITVLLKVSDK
jgi:hypothetical protein